MAYTCMVMACIVNGLYLFGDGLYSYGRKSNDTPALVPATPSTWTLTVRNFPTPAGPLARRDVDEIHTASSSTPGMGSTDKRGEESELPKLLPERVITIRPELSAASWDMNGSDAGAVEREDTVSLRDGLAERH